MDDKSSNVAPLNASPVNEIEVIVVGPEKVRAYENTRHGHELPVSGNVLPPDSHPSNSTGSPENGPTGLVVAATSPGSNEVPTAYVALVSGLAIALIRATIYLTKR